MDGNHTAAWKALVASREAIRREIEQPRKPIPRGHLIEIERHSRGFPQTTLRESDDHIFARIG